MATWLLLSLPLIASGCAINNYGLIAGKVNVADGALIVDIYSIGVHLRTFPQDGGLSFGVARRSYVFPVSEGDPPRPGWHVFHIPMPERTHVAADGRTLGLDLWIARAAVGVTLGYRATTTLAQIERDRDVAMDLSYEPSEPGATRLRYREGRKQCLDQP